jgi:hypothetical protein
MLRREVAKRRPVRHRHPIKRGIGSEPSGTIDPVERIPIEGEVEHNRGTRLAAALGLTAIYISGPLPIRGREKSRPASARADALAYA